MGRFSIYLTYIQDFRGRDVGTTPGILSSVPGDHSGDKGIVNPISALVNCFFLKFETVPLPKLRAALPLLESTLTVRAFVQTKMADFQQEKSSS